MKVDQLFDSNLIWGSWIPQVQQGHPWECWGRHYPDWRHPNWPIGWTMQIRWMSGWRINLSKSILCSLLALRTISASVQRGTARPTMPTRKSAFYLMRGSQLWQKQPALLWLATGRERYKGICRHCMFPKSVVKVAEVALFLVQHTRAIEKC